MPQHSVQRCRHPRTVPLAFVLVVESKQLDGLALIPHRLWPTLPASSPSGCSASALLGWVCRASTKPAGTPRSKSCGRSSPFPPCSPPIRQPFMSGSVSLKCPACREICACYRHSSQVAHARKRHSAHKCSEAKQYKSNGSRGQSLNRQLFLRLAMKIFKKSTSDGDI
jgi:hypothetical protein